jgi:uncharacterized protein (DUF302 family)
MSYHFSKRLDVPFDQAVTQVIDALKGEGFGILTDIDVRATLKSTRRGLSRLSHPWCMQPAACFSRIAA